MRKKKESVRGAERSQSLFEMMRMLTAEQRQRFGEIRRDMLSREGVKEKIEWDDKFEHWVLTYRKRNKRLARARFKPQELDYEEF